MFSYHVVLLFSSGLALILNDGYDPFWNIHPITPENVRLAYEEVILQFMDESVNPCEDFYSYACGKWESFSNRGAMASIYNRVARLTKNLLVDYDGSGDNIQPKYFFPELEDGSKASLTPAERKTIEFFQSCMNVELIRQRGTKIASEYIRSYTGFPFDNITSDKDEIEFDWLNMTAHLRLLQENVFINYRTGPFIGIDSFISSRSLINNTDFLCSCYDEKRIQKILEFVSVKEISSESVTEIVEFDKKLYEIYKHSKNQKIYCEIEELEEIIPDIEWREYLNVVQNKEFSDGQKIFVSDLNFFEKFSKLINDTSEIQLRKYLFFRLADFLYKNHENLMPGFAREKFCYKQTQKTLSVPLSAIFLRNFFDKSAEGNVIRIFDEIKEEFLTLVNFSEWIESVNKESFMEKIEETTLNAGYYRSGEFLKMLLNSYEFLEINSETYFENIIQLLQLQNIEDHNVIKSQIEYPDNPDPYYFADTNSVVISAAVLQPPYYHLLAPEWAKFGGIGFLIGHELSHALNFENFLYNDNSQQLFQPPSSIFTNYFAKVICLARQYNKFTFPESGKQVDGVRTVFENSADNIGMKIAFNSYKKWLEEYENEIDKKLSKKLNLTLTQLFFLSFGQNWCRQDRLYEFGSHVELSIKHASGRHRVTGILSNLNEFSEAFHCPVGSKMNPRKKCQF